MFVHREMKVFICSFYAESYVMRCSFLSVKDKLMTVPSEASGGASSSSWLFKNKEHGKASAAASLVRPYTIYCSFF